MESVARREEISLRYEDKSPAVGERVLKETPQISQPFTSIIVPAYDEEEGLPVVLESLFKAIDGTCEVIVVDDGSHDKTSEVASRFPCRLIKHEVNRGKGEAMKTGIRHSRGENVLFIDADATYPPEVIPQMNEALRSCDLVYGSRASGLDNMPYFNRLGNAMFQNMMKYIYGFKGNDWSTGLYGIKKSYLEKMDIKSHGFMIEVEIAIKASRMKLEVRDIPIDYLPRLGKTKLCSWKAGFGNLKTILCHVAWRGPQQDSCKAQVPVTYHKG